MRDEKGQGAYLSNQPKAAQKYMVVKWMESHKTGTIQSRAKQATEDLGFDVSPSTIATWHHAIYGPIYVSRPKRQSADANDIAAMIEAAVEKAIARMAQAQK